MRCGKSRSLLRKRKPPFDGGVLLLPHLLVMNAEKLLKGESVMDDYFEKLTNRLLEQNDQLSYSEARTWVELLWEDFEATYAKAGRSYKGKEMTERILNQWIDNHGYRLHEVLLEKPKYKEWFDKKKFLH